MPRAAAATALTDPTDHPWHLSAVDTLASDVQAAIQDFFITPDPTFDNPDPFEDPNLPHNGSPRDALLVLLPLLIVLSTLLFLLLLFLVCVILFRKRRGISLRDSDGPVDMSREDLIEGEGGFEGVESRWLETVSEEIRRLYHRAREYQVQYPPNSLPTDITLSQFLSIQEKGVSAWSFEPDYESLPSMLVHARTELTFLPDPSTSSSVQSNLPLPKLNEVYYWEVKMFDLPQGTTVAVGLATKPYPSFRLPGMNRFSVAYHSNGDKLHNYPFTATPMGPSLKEGDVLGVGYRPRTGTVFFTRNGRKMEDAFVGLSRWNLFPTVGADGPCSVHVNLGQSGFVFIEANVKKWGLAPSVGTLAPPPAYGSERGSILLEAGGGIRPIDGAGSPQSAANIYVPSTAISPPRRSHRMRRPKTTSSSMPVQSSPLRGSPLTPPSTPPPPITPIEEEDNEVGGEAGPSTSHRYISPTDAPDSPVGAHLPLSPTMGAPIAEGESFEQPSDSSDSASTPSPPPFASQFNTPRQQSPVHGRHSSTSSRSELAVQVHLAPPESPADMNPPTPNERDIHLRALTPGSGASSRVASTVTTSGVDAEGGDGALSPSFTRRDPPAYSPLDAFTYSEGVHIDLPAEVIAAALEGGGLPATAIGQGNHRHSRQSSRRRR